MKVVEMDIKMTTKKVIESLLSENPSLSISTDEEYYFIYGQIISHLTYLLYKQEIKYVHGTGNYGYTIKQWKEKFERCNSPKAQKTQVENFMKEYAYLIDLENRHLRNGLAMFFGYRPDKPMVKFGYKYYAYGTAVSTLFLKDATQISDFNLNISLE
ncbi:UNVERIFIED_CONTAM: hypothetical protein ABIC26_002888 [Paenibacillus sp. PvR008]